MTIAEARSLKRGQVLHRMLGPKNADGTEQRWKVNGKVRTWKRDPWRIEIPVKRGLYEYGTITAENLVCFIPAV